MPPIQYRIDVFAIFIFLGVVQAVFLSIFFLSAPNRKFISNLFFGLLLVSIAACNLEILLMYTGYIIHALHLVDFSEPVSFVIGPAFYLMVLSISRGSVSKYQYLHFAFAIIYFIAVLPFFLSDESVKYNSWIESYQLDLPYRNAADRDPRIFWITDHHTDLTLASIILYASLSLIEVIRAFRKKHESFWTTQVPALKSLRAGTWQIGAAIALTLIIKAFNQNDTGDHIFAAYLAMGIYLTSFRVMRQSGFFSAQTLADPEKKSVVTADRQELIIKNLREVMVKEKPFLNPDFSLPDLAQRLGTSVHALSHIINTGMGKSFFEMTAEYRINHARMLLKEQKYIKIEEIAERVGYNSKSSFNSAFKKITGQTPSEYRQQI